MLVWQDTPSLFYEDPFNAGISYRHPLEKAQHMHEMQRMIEVIFHYKPLLHTCIYLDWLRFESDMWVLFLSTCQFILFYTVFDAMLGHLLLPVFQIHGQS